MVNLKKYISLNSLKLVNLKRYCSTGKSPWTINFNFKTTVSDLNALLNRLKVNESRKVILIGKSLIYYKFSK